VERGRPEPADLVIDARWVIPIEPAGVVLDHHAVVVTAGRVVAIVPAAEARSRFAARERVSLDRHVLLPGLVNLHTHAAMALLRGLADDLPLMTWLTRHIWPVEGRLVSDEFVHDGTLLACGEMLRAGITCFNDMYFFPGATARAVERAGMRANAGAGGARCRGPRSPPAVLPGTARAVHGGRRRVRAGARAFGIMGCAGARTRAGDAG
jgi:5-methylthioadenosine/S-adenosylhomocysteine deaminase